MPTLLAYNPTGQENGTLEVPIEINDIYPTPQSIYNVFLGINKYMVFGEDLTPTQMVDIEKIIIVNFHCFYFLYEKKNDFKLIF